MYSATRTTLVTGGAGFLGAHLCRKLLQQGDRVICLDDLSTGRRENIEEHSDHPNFKFLHHDVREPIQVRVDRIFNLACPASPPAYQADPIKTTLTSVLGARNMLELARTTGARLLHASTSEVYGDPLIDPQPESYRGNVNPVGPRACYDEGKRCAESLIYDYRRRFGVDCRVARIFNTYGPGMRPDDGRLVSNFVVEALRQQDLTIYGEGSHTRSMCYVDDLIEGLLRLMSSEATPDGPINLGNPREISVLDFARLVIRATGSRSKVVHLPEPIDDPCVRCPDISRARAELHWAPRVTLERGLEETIAYFRRTLQADPATRISQLRESLALRDAMP